MINENKLSKQLLIIIVIVFILTSISIGVILPQSLTPIYEMNLYSYLKEPLNTIAESEMKKNINTEIGYVYIYDNQVAISNNYYDIMSFNVKELPQYLTSEYGKFDYKHQTYYYYQMKSGGITKIAITNDSYIIQNRQTVFYNVLPIIMLTFLIVALSLILWSGLIVRKIEKLKEKIDNFDNDNYDHDVTSIKINDEIKSLAFAIEDMRISLKKQEDIRNQMYQNISHDFKTPLTVIKSYSEAVKDGIEDADKALGTIEEQTIKLEQKVHSLLHLNKLDYLKDYENIQIEEVDLKKIINTTIEKFKFSREDIKYKVKIDDKVKFYGTEDLWESIIDNIFSNFTRYAKSEITITYNRGKLIFYNDGKHIEKELLDVIFVPFRKGIQGQFGLGMSIIKKTLNIINYDITIKNEKKGVSFIIVKETKK